MKHIKKENKEKPISKDKVYKIMVAVNKDLLSNYLKASLYELKESTWFALVRGKEKFYSGKLTKEKYDMMERQAYNLFDMIDHRIQLAK